MNNNKNKSKKRTKKLMRIFNDNNFENIKYERTCGEYFFCRRCNGSRRIWVNRELVRVDKKKNYIYTN